MQREVNWWGAAEAVRIQLTAPVSTARTFIQSFPNATDTRQGLWLPPFRQPVRDQAEYRPGLHRRAEAAGKSSLLDSLAQLNHEDEIPARDRTRVPQGAPLEPSIEARFELTEPAKDRFSQVPEAAKFTQFRVKKFANGEISYRPEPEPERDPERRRSFTAALEDLKGSRWMTGVAQIEPQLDPAPERSIQELLDAAVEITESSSANLGAGIDALTALRERLREIDAEQRQEADRKAEEQGDGEAPAEESHLRGWPSLPRKYEKLISALDDLVTYERKKHPLTQVIEALQEHVPEFIEFLGA